MILQILYFVFVDALHFKNMSIVGTVTVEQMTSTKAISRKRKGQIP